MAIGSVDYMGIEKRRRMMGKFENNGGNY